MAYIIPDVPSELKTQIKRERLLMKEAQYEHTASYQKDNDEYDDLLNAIRNSRSGTRLSDVIEQKNWARRMSQFSFASSSKKSPFPTVSTLTVAESVDSIKWPYMKPIKSYSAFQAWEWFFPLGNDV